MVIDILMFIIFWFLGYAVCYAWHKKDAIGNILIVDDEGEKTLMLEVYERRSQEIRPGNIVKLTVKKENLTRK